MERLINSDSKVTQLWNYNTLRNSEDGGDLFFETSVLTRISRHKVPEVIIIIQKLGFPSLGGGAMRLLLNFLKLIVPGECYCFKHHHIMDVRRHNALIVLSI
jgi:hypothetical protein